MLKVENLSYEVDGQKILDDINFEFLDGKFYVITGQNGAGKSTLAKCLMGLCKANGKILFDGKDITDKPVNERANMGIGFAFQQPVSFKGIRVIDILKTSGKPLSITQNALRQVGLNPSEYLLREFSSKLSGGEQKRVELASVLVRRISVGIFDEPEAGIDIWSFKQLSKALKEFKTKERTMIVISHQERVMKLADEIILMKDGKIQKHGTRDEMMKELKN